MIRAILTDIEGTTSSITFVKDVLFPYARDHMADFIRAHAADAEVRRLLNEVCGLAGRSLSDEEAISQLIHWIDEDRKLTPLKALQGLIWDEGYRRGDFRGHLYEDAVRKLREWQGRGLALYVYSSGSVHAQKLLFGHTDHGDLNALFSGYFDTTVGAKLDADSYRKIAGQTGFFPHEILFLSDMEAELDAAREAGFDTCQIIREGQALGKNHPACFHFDDVIL